MPQRYHIQTTRTPGRFDRVGKFGGIDWREDCARCAECVKPRCTFDVYSDESGHNRDPLAPLRPLYACRACLSCVQGCTKGLLSLSVNPEFLDMGDRYWTPDLIATSWNQADDGKVPVSGAGYRGPFCGSGFDSIWTDMSEIVRPTRDGIHGREYISTSVDVGPRPPRLYFCPDGTLREPAARLLEIPLPVVLDMPARFAPAAGIAAALAMAARQLGTVALLPAGDAERLPEEDLAWVAPILDGGDHRVRRGLLEKTGAMVELRDGPGVADLAEAVEAARPGAILSVRMALRPGTAGRIDELAGRGFRVFHLCADPHGCQRAPGGRPGRHLKDALREIHGRLVDGGLRDEVTLIASGGIALAEHMAKAILCGSDLVAADIALLVSLGCRVCPGANLVPGGSEGLCRPPDGLSCPVACAAGDPPYAARRMVNLMGAWHSQLLEVLGAMGIREVRRLRGETGRAIFMEDIEKEAFGDLARVPPGPSGGCVEWPGPGAEPEKGRA